MDFQPSERSADLAARVRHFIDTEITPVEQDYHRQVEEIRQAGGNTWEQLPVIDGLRAEARLRGLWNLFLPAGHEGEYAEKYGTDGGTGLSNVDYAPVA